LQIPFDADCPSRCILRISAYCDQKSHNAYYNHKPKPADRNELSLRFNPDGTLNGLNHSDTVNKHQTKLPGMHRLKKRREEISSWRLDFLTTWPMYCSQPEASAIFPFHDWYYFI
jgi:hypothetical protein